MNMLSQKVQKLIIVCVAVLGLSTSSCKPSAEDRPNFLVIVTDDQRAGLMDYMPITQERIFEEGVIFSNAYVTTAQCCPSRASILTGMYAHSHGVIRNNVQLEETTFPAHLQASGYHTAMVGKYLNSYPSQIEDPPLPEFDQWIATRADRDSSDRGFFDPPINFNGEVSQPTGYQTYILRDYALEVIRQAAAQEQPFMLWFSTRAVHAPATPAPGDEMLYPDLPTHRPPSFNENNVSDKPMWLQEQSTWSERETERVDAFRQRQLQSLHSVDEVVGSLLTELESQGMLDETVIIFISDNALFWGEHRLRGKNAVYEEAIHVPFAIRYPPLIEEPYVDDHLVGNIDIAPTIYELAGVAIPPEVEGRSLMQLFQGQEEWRHHLIIEGWPTDRPDFAAIHTERYVYVANDGDIEELYDLQEDPYQLENLAHLPEYLPLINDMRQSLFDALPDFAQ